MNILKKINLKQNFELSKLFLKEYVLLKQSLVAIGISLIFSLLIIQISVPKFAVSATLREAQSSGGGIQIRAGGESSSILSKVVGTSSLDKSYDEIISNMRSYVVG